jgi:2',3'-cyclic-nucleotide 2'-phosphodiesterase (5'-nucleotidase family)
VIGAARRDFSNNLWLRADWSAVAKDSFMRISVRSVAAGFLSFFLLACSFGVAQQATPLHVRIIATHDIHGALQPTTSFSWSNGRPIGGVNALKATIDSLKADCPCPSFWLDGGDQMQGTLASNLVRGASAVAALNYMGLDAAAVGNHELDWGVDTLLTRQSEAHYAWLAANVFRADNGERPSWAKPFTIIERGGVKVGVVGYATVRTPFIVHREIVKPFEFRHGYAGIGDALDAVWGQQPDFVVVVAHAGGDCSAEGCEGEMVDLASELPSGRVQLIVGGHSHRPGEAWSTRFP